jgi:hypothetical protein
MFQGPNHGTLFFLGVVMKFFAQLRSRTTRFFLSVFRREVRREEHVQEFLNNLPALKVAEKRIQILVHLNDLNKALEVANEIPDRFSRDSAVDKIIRTLLEMDRIEEAKIWIEQIRAEHVRDTAWLDVVLYLARKKKGVEAWMCVGNILDQRNRDHARCEMINKLFPSISRLGFPDLRDIDYLKWRQWILEIESDRSRDYQLSSFVACLVNRDKDYGLDYSEARGFVQEIVTLEFRFRVWAHLFLWSQLESDFSSAKELAIRIDEMNAEKGMIYHRQDPKTGKFVETKYPTLLILDGNRRTQSC